MMRVLLATDKDSDSVGRIMAERGEVVEQASGVIGRREWGTALGLFALLAGIYLLTAGGHTYSIDEELMFGAVESLVLRGTLALDMSEPTYSSYGPGQSLVAVPFYWLGQVVAQWFPSNSYAWITRAIVVWLNAFVTAGNSALVYLAVFQMGYRRRVAIGTALIFALATLSWHYSKTFFAEPLTAFFLFAAFVAAQAALIQAAHGDWIRSLLLLGGAGALAGLAPAVKIHATLSLPLLLLVVGIHLWRVRGSIAEHWWMGGLAWCAGAGLTFGGLLLFQWQTYGHPLHSGYGDTGGVLQSMLGRDLVWPIFGLVLSFGKGIIWFAPPLLLWPLGMWLLLRRDWPVALLCGTLAVSHIVFFASWSDWHGAGAWGPRFLVIVLPFLVLPLAPVLASVQGWRTPGRTGVLLLTLLLAVPVQVGGVAINYTAFKSLPGERGYAHLAESVLVVHLQMAGEQLAGLYQIHAAPESVGLVRGFRYSEGTRETGEQVPRWTGPQAEFALRPPQGAASVRLDLALSSCRPVPVAAGSVTLVLDGEPLLTGMPCPPRVYRLVLPGRSARLSLVTSGWEPQAVGVDREDGPLGVWLRAVQAQAGKTDLAIRGQLVPPSPLPDGAGPVTIRQWVSDHRYDHWDFWWWYLALSGFPQQAIAALMGFWFGLAAALMAVGVWGLRWGGQCHGYTSK
jgi:hypothetical protein